MKFGTLFTMTLAKTTKISIFLNPLSAKIQSESNLMCASPSSFAVPHLWYRFRILQERFFMSYMPVIWQLNSKKTSGFFEHWLLDFWASPFHHSYIFATFYRPYTVQEWRLLRLVRWLPNVFLREEILLPSRIQWMDVSSMQRKL